MKREGRQHGMVRTYRILPSPWNSRPETRFVQQFDSPPTAGLFNKVSMKPTNHSKFTGRCGRPRCQGCHMHPVCKAKDKTKGTNKLRSSDMATNYRLVAWRVVDGKPGLKFSGFSATRVLDHLYNDYEDYCEGNDDHDYDGDGDGDDQRDLANDGLKVNSQSLESVESYEGENTRDTTVDHSKDDDDVDDDDDDEKNKGANVVVDDDDDDEGWCLVGEI